MRFTVHIRMFSRPSKRSIRVITPLPRVPECEEVTVPQMDYRVSHHSSPQEKYAMQSVQTQGKYVVHSRQGQEKYAVNRVKHFPIATINQELMPHEGSSLVMNSSASGGSGFPYIHSDAVTKMAGMKLFLAVMLKAWRTRSKEVKRLLEQVDELKRGSSKVNNQLHVFNTLYNIEQKRNEDLRCQLKLSLDNVRHVKCSCDSLATTVISIKADKALLEEELQGKHREIDVLHGILNQTKADLFRSMVEQRNMHSCLSKEQRYVQYLDNQKNKLINEICELGAEHRKMEEKYRKELNKKDEELHQFNQQIQELQASIAELEAREIAAQKAKENCELLKKEIQQIQSELDRRQKLLETSVAQRIRCYWKRVSVQSVLRFAHYFTFCLLPATPPPKFTLTSKLTGGL